jgi:RNA polymerase sigma-70 factor (ECF subfamily)
VVIPIKDKRILLMFYNRDEQALQATIAEYGALCRAVARDILEDEQDVEECVNDALLTVWNAIPPAKPDNYRAYLLKILRNIALNRYKANHRNKRGNGPYHEVLDELAEILPSPQNTEDIVAQREMLSAISRFLSTVPHVQRDIFVRRYWSFSSFADLANDFNMTENHVKVTLTRLRKRLQKYLKKENLL